MKKFAIAFLLAAVLPAGAASAKPVSQARARVVIRHDLRDFPYQPHVQWCRRYRYGTLCRVGVRACFDDAVYGPSAVVTYTLVWVSRTRGTLTAAPVGLPFTNIYAGDPACQ